MKRPMLSTRKVARGLTALAAVLSAPLPASHAAAPAAARRPNVVILLADDLGYADVGFHGCKDVPTPHIDSERVPTPLPYAGGRASEKLPFLVNERAHLNPGVLGGAQC